MAKSEQGRLFTDDYYRSLRSEHWKTLRAKKFKSVAWGCEMPGCGARCTDLHHKHYDTFAAEGLNDVLAVCRFHHKELERDKVQKRNAKGLQTYMAKKYGENWKDHIEEHEAWEDFEFWLERQGVQIW